MLPALCNAGIEENVSFSSDLYECSIIENDGNYRISLGGGSYSIPAWHSIAPTDAVERDGFIQLRFSDSAVAVFSKLPGADSWQLTSWQVFTETDAQWQFSFYSDFIKCTVWENGKEPGKTYVVYGKVKNSLELDDIDFSLLPGEIDDLENVISYSGRASASSTVQDVEYIPIYQSPNTKSNIMIHLLPGAPLQVSLKDGAWAHVTIGGITGWIQNSNLCFERDMLETENSIFVETNAVEYSSLMTLHDMGNDGYEAAVGFIAGYLDDNTVLIYDIPACKLQFVDRSSIMDPYSG